MKPTDSRIQRASKCMSWFLRHHPEEARLTLESQGWAPVTGVLAALDRLGHRLSAQELSGLVADDLKGRYSFSPDGSQIRANQGHSKGRVAITHREAEPPAELYHGTVERFLEAIMREGLRPMSREHVHLSPDVQTATAVGQRRGKPVILTVDAAGMRKDGLTFWLSENGVWLCDHVPAERLTLIR